MSTRPAIAFETRPATVSGAWLGRTWVDDAVLRVAEETSRAGLPFLAPSHEVGEAFVGCGLAVWQDRRRRVLRGTALLAAVAAELADDAAPAEPDAAWLDALFADDEATGADPAQALGHCSSSHHPAYTPATVRGVQAVGDGSPFTMHVTLCDRCADLLGAAGYFVAC